MTLVRISDRCSRRRVSAATRISKVPQKSKLSAPRAFRLTIHLQSSLLLVEGLVRGVRWSKSWARISDCHAVAAYVVFTLSVQGFIYIQSPFLPSLCPHSTSSAQVLPPHKNFTAQTVALLPFVSTSTMKYTLAALAALASAAKACVVGGDTVSCPTKTINGLVANVRSSRSASLRQPLTLYSSSTTEIRGWRLPNTITSTSTISPSNIKATGPATGASPLTQSPTMG